MRHFRRCADIARAVAVILRRCHALTAGETAVTLQHLRPAAARRIAVCIILRHITGLRRILSVIASVKGWQILIRVEGAVPVFALHRAKTAAAAAAPCTGAEYQVRL